MNPFDFLNAINTTKIDLIKEDPTCEREYVPFLINKSLSYYQDTIFFANEMNKYSSLPKTWQFDFYLNAIPKRKRYAPWAKPDKATSDIKLLMRVYNYSAKRANEALSLLTDEQLKSLRKTSALGGR